MTAIRNKPSPDGYALGEHLDRFCEREIEKYREAGLAVFRRCDTCAFRKGTYVNGCVPTVMDALKCTLEGDTTFLLRWRAFPNHFPSAAFQGFFLTSERRGIAIRIDALQNPFVLWEMHR